MIAFHSRFCKICDHVKAHNFKLISDSVEL
jgi:hypothetical protein